MLNSKSILVVDDDPLMLAVISEYLGALYSLKFAKTLKEAGKELSVEKFDVVLLDKNLPDGDGVEFVQEAKRLSPNTAIVILSGESKLQGILRALELGAEEYVIKGERLGQELHLRIPMAIQRHLEKTLLNQPKTSFVLPLPSVEEELTQEQYANFTENAEGAFLERALRICEGNVEAASARLGIGRSTLFKKMKSLGVRKRGTGDESLVSF